MLNDFYHYEIVGELGRGTTGTVYKARQALFNRRVALKVPALLPDADRDVKAKRFRLECQTLAYLTSGPDCNIPRLCDVSENAAGQLFSVRELVDGNTLEQLAADGSIDLRASLAIVADVARVVQWVHGRGFTHRNLCAANVLVTRDGNVMLIGFGRVGLLTGSHLLPAGATGQPAEIDVSGLRELLWWLFGALRHPVASFERAIVPGDATSVESFREAIVTYLRRGG